MPRKDASGPSTSCAKAVGISLPRSPSILPVHPAVGNPVGHAVKIGFSQRNAVAQLRLVLQQLVARAPEIELQHFASKLAAFARQVAWPIAAGHIVPTIRVRQAAD